MAEAIEPSEIDGQVILIGLTHVKDDVCVKQEQFAGAARIVDREKLCLVSVDCTDGKTRDWPFDQRTIKRARPGEYQLRSTGEVIVDPKFLMTWTVTKGENE